MSIRYLYISITFFLIGIANFLQAQRTNETCPVVGLVLSGGGAKGYAHIGALEVLEENDIYPNLIGGTSMGSIIGGLYASGYTAEQLDSVLKKVDPGGAIFSKPKRQLVPIFDKTYSEKYILQLPFNNFKLRMPQAISSGQGANNELVTLTRHVHDIKNYKDLSTPFFCIATDLETGEQVIQQEGFLSESIIASSAFPSLVAPKLIDGRLLVDGGVVNNFPVKEMKDFGAEIIIGIDVQEDTIKREDLISINNVLEQLSTLKNMDYYEQQKKLTDVFVNVDIEGYGVTDFDKKTEIIARGREAMIESLPDIVKKIPAQCRTEQQKRVIKHDINRRDSLYINEIRINGLKNYTASYFFSQIKMENDKVVSYEQVIQSVERLYATGNFLLVEYRLDKESEKNVLIYNLTEDSSKIFIKLGMHYDTTYKTGFLANLTFKNLGLKNSSLSTDFVIGDRFRWNVNYFIDNGLIPSFGLNYAYRNASLKSINFGSDEKQTYNFEDQNIQLYMQSTLLNRYAGGLGMEYDYTKILSDSELKISSGSYTGPYAFLRMDNREQSNFNTSGGFAYLKYKYLLFSDEPDFKPISFFKLEAEYSFPLNKNFAIRLGGSAGATLSGEDLPVGQQFYLGGINEQPLVNYQKLLGYDFMEIQTDNFFTTQVSLQYNFLKNHYLTATVGGGTTADRVEKTNYLDMDDLGAFGMEYGFNSIFGPLRFVYSYTPAEKKNHLYATLGFWF